MRSDDLLRHSAALAQRIFQTSGETAVCQQVVDAVASLLDAQQGSVALYRPEEQELVIVSTHGYPGVLIETVRVRPGEAIIGSVFAMGVPLVVEDVAKHWPDRHPRHRYRSRSFLCAPIIGGRDVLGVLSLTDRVGSHPFDADDLIAVRALTIPVALALARERLAAGMETISREMVTDTLTGAFSRRYFIAHAEQDCQRTRRAGSSLALLMLDVDNFKQFNDAMGHPAGDEVLRRVASTLKQTVRSSDICARLGGEEFAALMPESSVASARQIAERIRERVKQQLQSVSVSIGVAGLTPECSFQELIQRADQALYRAKAEGKNCVRVWTL